MDLDGYQSAAAEYDFACPTRGAVWYYALGLCGEAGELAEKVKKHYRDESSLDRVALTKELGDVLWFVALLAGHLGVSLELVASLNLQKLGDRAARDALIGSGDNR